MPEMIFACQLDSSFWSELEANAISLVVASALFHVTRFVGLELGKIVKYSHQSDVVHGHKEPERDSCREMNETMCYTNIQQVAANVTIEWDMHEQNNGHKFQGIDLPVQFGHRSEDGMHCSCEDQFSGV